MTPSRLELAVLNNVAWYQAMFAAHGLAHREDGRVWFSHDSPPAYHSNLVVLAADVSQPEADARVNGLATRLHRRWSIKDSWANLDLSPLGFCILFEATWIWREPSIVGVVTAGATLDWSRLRTPAELAEWESAWWGDARNQAHAEAGRQFPDGLLASGDHAFFAGRLGGQGGGPIVAGGVANRSAGAVGLSNLFASPELAGQAWCAIVNGISNAFPGQPIVGYERGDDLMRARQVGFEPVGPLRVWERTTA